MKIRRRTRRRILRYLFILILMGASAFGGWYLGNNKELVINQETEEKEEKTTKTTFNKMNFNKCRNCTIGALYYPGMANVSGLNVIPNADQKSVKIYANANQLNETYQLGLNPSVDNYSYDDLGTKTFDKKIVQIYMGGWGQSSINDMILYVMEDGTVEYTPIVKDIKENWTKDNDSKFKSYGKIDKVEDVIYITTATISSSGNSSGGYTIIAVRVDGMYYDLSKNLANKK